MLPGALCQKCGTLDDDDIKLTNLDSVTEFLTTGYPFEAFKRNLHRFLHPEQPLITHP